MSAVGSSGQYAIRRGGRALVVCSKNSAAPHDATPHSLNVFRSYFAQEQFTTKFDFCAIDRPVDEGGLLDHPVEKRVVHSTVQLKKLGIHRSIVQLKRL